MTTDNFHINRLAILGVGLIGGSLARYFHDKGFARIRCADKKPLPEWYQRVPGMKRT